MKKRNLILCSLLISTAFIGYSKADDSVVVNLHVLDGLSGVSSVGSYVAQQPLFPVVKKSPIVKKKKTPKKVQIKSELSASAPEIKVEVKKDMAPKEMVSATVSSKTAPTQQIPFVEDTEPVVVVDVEPVSVAPSTKITPAEKNPQQDSKPVIEEKTTEDSGTPKLLIDETATTNKKAIGSSLVFALDSDEITEDLQKQIDQIVASFTNPADNKIAIYSYNLEDGVEAFKKKRISLNRAVAIRSYLLPKGYKNFSIKVINIDGSSDKGNTVELEELKN